MKVSDLKGFLKRMPDTAEVDVMIENTEQWQFPLNDCAYSARNNKVILMHEKWTGSESGPQPSVKKD